ncbi:MAG: gluconeogenesis factor YvcK family protein [Terriglobia bacterium]
MSAVTKRFVKPVTEPLRIVSIGGGTGLSSLLNGLKAHCPRVDITAIVTVSDDGGSSGRLRREFDILPPGDIRNCMVALSEDEALLSRLFQYRFQAGHGLKGHSFGNLFLTALTEITGDFPDAVRKSCEVLKIAGRIFPSTAADVSLEAVLEGGRVVRGESKISRSKRPILEIRMIPARPRPLREALEAIAQADLITMGPGSLFTSVIPNLLVEGIPRAMRQSRALKACFVNLMCQPGETTGFRASDHVRAIHAHGGPGLVDCAVVNTTSIRPLLRRRYAAESAAPVENDLDALRALGVEVLEAELLQKGPKVRHNPEAIGAVTLELAMRARERGSLRNN